jgi:dihydroorotate dehydrogenase (NAD+) catalytic subunit
VIVSISAIEDPSELVFLAKRLEKCREVAAIELNISCPNIRKLAGSPVRRFAGATDKVISQDPMATYNLVKAARKITSKTLVTKLSPNVTDIAEIALAAEKAGSDAVSLVNTLAAMSIDIESRRPKLAMTTGGLSGPAIRPIAVRMVWECAQKIKIPIIGMGGIIDTSSALEFCLAGATAISIGTANFIHPRVSIEIISGIKKYMVRHKIKDIQSLRGSLKI